MGYVAGMTLLALERAAVWNSESRYRELVLHHMDGLIDKDGTIRNYQLEDYNLDMINEGKNLFSMEAYGDEKYRQAILRLVDQLKGQPRTSEGGFWHKNISIPDVA